MRRALDIEALEAPPIVGRRYWVPCVRTKGMLWPVIGPQHADADLGVPEEHLHCDARFMSNRQVQHNLDLMFAAAAEVPGAWLPKGEDQEHAFELVRRSPLAATLASTVAFRAAGMRPPTPHLRVCQFGRLASSGCASTCRSRPARAAPALCCGRRRDLRPTPSAPVLVTTQGRWASLFHRPVVGPNAGRWRSARRAPGPRLVGAAGHARGRLRGAARRGRRRAPGRRRQPRARRCRRRPRLVDCEELLAEVDDEHLVGAASRRSPPRPGDERAAGPCPGARRRQRRSASSPPAIALAVTCPAAAAALGARPARTGRQRRMGRGRRPVVRCLGTGGRRSALAGPKRRPARRGARPGDRPSDRAQGLIGRRGCLAAVVGAGSTAPAHP
jgi:hypothetical protein